MFIICILFLLYHLILPFWNCTWFSLVFFHCPPALILYFLFEIPPTNSKHQIKKLNVMYGFFYWLMEGSWCGLFILFVESSVIDAWQFLVLTVYFIFPKNRSGVRHTNMLLRGSVFRTFSINFFTYGFPVWISELFFFCFWMVVLFVFTMKYLLEISILLSNHAWTLSITPSC